ncbi:uncharacterized protein L969DRAFT_50896 [Mixia osmundae IAM 14324]|uniref:Enoyl-CoA hydratase n=1 Tax=Mixia osmundae (strain CBS 9802 / IAM 14324 / JCM 22182 / KY 12970) TaxID=764103 RepID=G7E7G1_MIXOS|nr:uncharacterized protein L969DRAFT_50896 [Mixia osmundae IAM 14324]KEI38374.1 hypothetical protein L969DRAFT_50896 [Mixia osmundae IAM 14324]GAA98771.1 hypothetical protein E5Q_05459 [Mixia osmundae IAM 14324]
MGSLVDYQPKLFIVDFPSDGVLVLSMNRGPVNAFNQAFWEELHRLFDLASNDPDVRVVVLASKLDKLYTAGLDLTDTGALTDQSESDSARMAWKMRRHILDFQAAISAIEECKKPVIAAVHGICIGLGVDITSAADIRMAASSAQFGIKEVTIGLAADIGSLQRFPLKVANDSWTRELVYTGRNFDAAEAHQHGFVSNVVQGGRSEVLAAAIELAKDISNKSPIAVQGSKHLLDYSRDHSVQDGLAYTATWNMSQLQASDLVEAVGAFMTKKPPRFAKL